MDTTLINWRQCYPNRPIHKFTSEKRIKSIFLRWTRNNRIFNVQRQALLCCKSPLEGRLYMLWIMAIPFTDVASIVATIACNLLLCKKKRKTDEELNFLVFVSLVDAKTCIVYG
ncbi:hypothetical protein R3W88_017650 [Solanum pinnatisectum]|uniref:Uncharacterized protein n=1 Tax=Solanum pinnatisectum TaxID=50273 RepID=A0AAV9L1X8_9SOLN|nr:hypothetical protein R3W88_017650 [Solanum pinnatisectum]